MRKITEKALKNGQKKYLFLTDEYRKNFDASKKKQKLELISRFQIQLLRL